MRDEANLKQRFEVSVKCWTVFFFFTSLSSFSSFTYTNFDAFDALLVPNVYIKILRKKRKPKILSEKKKTHTRKTTKTTKKKDMKRCHKNVEFVSSNSSFHHRQIWGKNRVFQVGCNIANVHTSQRIIITIKRIQSRIHSSSSSSSSAASQPAASSSGNRKKKLKEKKKHIYTA